MRSRTSFFVVSAAFILSAVFVFSSSASAAAKTKTKTAVTVSNGKTVTLNYTLKVDGKVVDTSKGRSPLVVKIGAHQVIPGFENGIMGMKAGQKKSFTVSPKEGYGEVNPKAIVKVEKSKLPQRIQHKLKPGMVLYTRAPNGRVMPVKVAKVGKNHVTMDFNSPLAGKTLNFDVEVVDIK